MSPIRFLLVRHAELLRRAPLLLIGLWIYVSLRSTSIFPYNLYQETDWRPAYAGWYDAVLAATLGLSLFKFGAFIPIRSYLFAFGALLLIAASVLLRSLVFSQQILWDALVTWMRFALPFLLMIGLIRRCGAELSHALAFGIGLILAASSLMVLSLNPESFIRLFAAAMTSASFGQCMLILCMIAVLRGHTALAVVFAMFLLFTLSRSALIVFALFQIFYFRNRFLSAPAEAVRFAVLTLACTVCVLWFFRSETAFQEELIGRVDSLNLSTLNSRTLIWSFGLEVLLSGTVPATGIGFGMQPYFLSTFRIDPASDFFFVHFHSILLEYAIGLGVLAIPLAAVLILRVIQCWHAKLSLPAWIFTSFLLTQSIDYTLYPPKEMLVWGLFLGIAEGEWLLVRHKRSSLQPVSKFLGSARLAAAPAT